MCVRFISFIFVLIISVGWTSDPKNMTTREKLANSLTHMQDMLVVIEAKLEQERKLLSQISDSLTHKKGHAVGRKDYVEPTDIWWQPSNPVDLAYERGSLFNLRTLLAANPGATKPGATKAGVQIYLSTFLPNLLTTVNGTTVPNTTASPFIQDMKKNMAIDKSRYFPAFLTRFLELIAIKDPAETMPVIHFMTESIHKDINQGKFDEHPAPHTIIIGPLTALIPIVQNMTAPVLKEQARLAYFALKNKETMLSTGYISTIDFYGKLFTTTDGERLLEALEAFYEFPKGQATAFDVSNKMLTALLDPYMRLQEHYVNGLPRRNMNLKQNDKHILLKKPKRLKHVKNSQHHRILYKEKRLKKYSRSREGLLNKRDEIRRRAYVPSEQDYNNSEYLRDSIENDKLHKIREALSHSDEEDQLINNLHDALTNGNRLFKSHRKSDSDINNKETLRALSDETDDEWILKNNIYKIFEQDKERSL